MNVCRASAEPLALGSLRGDRKYSLNGKSGNNFIAVLAFEEHNENERPYLFRLVTYLHRGSRV